MKKYIASFLLMVVLLSSCVVVVFAGGYPQQVTDIGALKYTLYAAWKDKTNYVVLYADPYSSAGLQYYASFSYEDLSRICAQANGCGLNCTLYLNTHDNRYYIVVNDTQLFGMLHTYGVIGNTSGYALSAPGPTSTPSTPTPSSPSLGSVVVNLYSNFSSDVSELIKTSNKYLYDISKSIKKLEVVLFDGIFYYCGKIWSDVNMLQYEMRYYVLPRLSAIVSGIDGIRSSLFGVNGSLGSIHQTLGDYLYSIYDTMHVSVGGVDKSIARMLYVTMGGTEYTIAEAVSIAIGQLQAINSKLDNLSFSGTVSAYNDTALLNKLDSISSNITVRSNGIVNAVNAAAYDDTGLLGQLSAMDGNAAARMDLLLHSISDSVYDDTSLLSQLGTMNSNLTEQTGNVVKAVSESVYNDAAMLDRLDTITDLLTTQNYVCSFLKDPNGKPYPIVTLPYDSACQIVARLNSTMQGRDITYIRKDGVSTYTYTFINATLSASGYIRVRGQYSNGSMDTTYLCDKAHNIFVSDPQLNYTPAIAAVTSRVGDVVNALSNLTNNVSVSIEEITNYEIPVDNTFTDIWNVGVDDDGNQETIVDTAGDSARVMGRLLSFLYNVAFKDAIKDDGIDGLNDFYFDTMEGVDDVWGS